MLISINGEAAEVANGLTVADLLASLDKNPKFLAVERNQKLIPRKEHANCVLSEGDDVEIVTMVGGG